MMSHEERAGAAVPVHLLAASPEAAPTVAALEHAAATDPWHEPPTSTAGWRGLLVMPGAFTLVAAGAEGPAGYAYARVAVDEAELLAIGVVPSARRRGIGRALLAGVAAQARRRGARRLFLEVAAPNAAARRLYADAGFVEVGRRPDYYRGDSGRVAALVMRLALGRQDF
jgi:ribosomal-protein-alanine N-acetyltransferase